MQDLPGHINGHPFAAGTWVHGWKQKFMPKRTPGNHSSSA